MEKNDVKAAGLIRSAFEYTAKLHKEVYCTELADALTNLKVCLFHLEARHWRRTKQGVSSTSKVHNHDAPVPFSVDDVLKLPIGPDGHIIAKIPELEIGKIYTHNRCNSPTGPAAFMDPKEKISVYCANTGLIEGVAIEDLNWELVKEYKKFEPIDAEIADFGLF